MGIMQLFGKSWHGWEDNIQMNVQSLVMWSGVIWDIEAADSFEKSLYIYQTTPRHIQDSCNLHIHRRENFKGRPVYTAYPNQPILHRLRMSLNYINFTRGN
jgi:hypothetical protein